MAKKKSAPKKAAKKKAIEKYRDGGLIGERSMPPRPKAKLIPPHAGDNIKDTKK